MLETELLTSKVIEEKEQDKYSGVWVFVEHADGVVNQVVYELLGKGRAIADELGVDLALVLLGSNLNGISEKLVEAGADILYCVDNPILRNFNDETYSRILVQLVQNEKPEIVLVGATIHGRSLAPRVASVLNTGLTADCIQLDVDTEKRILLQTRTAFGGNIMATIVCAERRPQMATIRHGVLPVYKPEEVKQAKVIYPKVDIPQSVRTEIINSSIQKDGKKILDTDIIIAVGKGIENVENIALVRQVAEKLGASIGATRGVVDEGWLEHSYQIGQTGKNVHPKVYIACGISGAIQHVVGMNASDTIIAINKDPNASIFGIADYGIVGDVREIMESILEQLN